MYIGLNDAAEQRNVERRNVRPAVAASLAGLALLLYGFQSTWGAIVRVWSESETFNHGFAVAPLAAWLVWRQRDRLMSITPHPSWWGAIALSACCALWLVASAAGINVLAAFAVVASIPALVVACFGIGIARSIAFPLAFLLFMVPAGEGLTPFLMEGTADATVWAVSASGVPVYREGLGFMLPTGRWSVVEACSGLRYVIAAGVLSSLFAYLNFGRTRTRVVFIAAALAVALVANWIRAYLIVMIGHLSGMRLGVGDDHVWYGWAFFGLTMFVVFWMGARWKEPSEGSSALPTSAGGERRGDVSPASTGGDRWMRQLPALAAVCTVGLAPLVLGALQDTQPLVDVGARVQASLNGPIEQGEPLVVPRFSGATATIQGILDPGHATDGYLAYYARQQRGSELITFGNSVLQSDDPNWRIASTSVGSIGFGSGNVRFREWIVRSKGADRLLWSWYTVGGREAAGEMGTKGLTAWAVLTGRGDHSTVTVLGTRIEQSGEGPVNPDALEAARRRLGSEMPGWVAGARMATGRR